jgi:threonine dehydrogenase-like Zn-dependent dehydrogenase
MRAAVISSAGACRIEEVPLPPLAPNEVLVRLEGSGVCASNIPVWEGRPWFTYPQAPGAPGHEGWGVVEAVGEAVAGVRPGTRAAIISSHAYAEYDVCDASALVPLPDSLADVPMPGEPLACAVNVMKRINLQPGAWIAIVGIGFMGAVLTRLAALRGAHVIAISRRRFALDVAERFGADALLSFDDPQHVCDEVRRIVGDEMLRYVVEAVGTQSALDLATSLTGIRGRLVIAGYHQDGLRQVDLQQWNWKGLDVVNAHERDTSRYVEGLRAAVQLVADDEIDVKPLLSEPFPLESLDAAFRSTIDRPDGFMKAIVTPRSRT